MNAYRPWLSAVALGAVVGAAVCASFGKQGAHVGLLAFAAVLSVLGLRGPGAL